MSDKPLGFVALKSIRQGPPDSQATIAEIRQIYFKTTKRTIQHDIVHAIELLKRLPSEDDRDKAADGHHGHKRKDEDGDTNCQPAANSTLLFRH